MLFAPSIKRLELVHPLAEPGPQLFIDLGETVPERRASGAAETEINARSPGVGASAALSSASLTAEISCCAFCCGM